MGLDMYLMSSTKGEIGYWRKANQIHGFFSNNLSKCDNCRDNPVPVDVLENLLDLCVKVKDSLIFGGVTYVDTVVKSGYKNGEFFEEKGLVPVYKNTSLALQLLPPTSGFFFGNDLIDEWYLKDLNNTIDIITNALSTKEKGERFYYHPWW